MITYSCTTCGQSNALSSAHLFFARCGACSAPLGAPAVHVDLTDATLESAVRESVLPVSVAFWAPWCGFCAELAPRLDESARGFAGRVLFGRVNIDPNPQAKALFEAHSIPLLVGFVRGQVVARQAGAIGMPALSTWILQLASRGA